VRLEHLWEYGSAIASGPVPRLLTENPDVFHQAKDAVRAAGLAAASSSGTDDTGARPQGQNGYGTALGNERFAYFESSASKSRLNFLPVRQGPQRHDASNETTRASGERPKRAAAAFAQRIQGPPEGAGEDAWTARRAALGITNERPVLSVTAGALVGGWIAQGVAPDLGIVSEGAPPFVIWVHAAWWVHAERPLAKRVPHPAEHRGAIEQIRARIWDLYQDRTAYRAQPDDTQRPLLAARFDAFVGQRTGYPNSNAVLTDMRDHPADWRRVLERPEIPLHHNALESDIREYVQRRTISGGPRSAAGRRGRDTIASLQKTCRKLGSRFWDYCQDRVRGRGHIPRLADLIRQKAPEPATQNAAAVPV